MHRWFPELGRIITWYGRCLVEQARKTPVITGKLFTALSLSPPSLPLACTVFCPTQVVLYTHIVNCTFQLRTFLSAHGMYLVMSVMYCSNSNTSNSCNADMLLLEVHCSVFAQSFPLLYQCRRVEFHSNIQNQQLDRHFRSRKPD